MFRTFFNNFWSTTRKFNVASVCLIRKNMKKYASENLHQNFIKQLNNAIPKLNGHNVTFVTGITVLQWLGFEKSDEKKESELIMTLKRSVLCTQRQEYKKAEQMLHIALRLAQQQQNRQGVMYCYDLMANLAMDTYQLEKAQKLFVTLMQMFLQDGINEDDNKFIHVSLKVARINHLLAKDDVAEVGYKWCLEKLNKVKDRDLDTKLLNGVVNDWYAQFLLDRGQVKESVIHLKEAYNSCCAVKGENSEQGMLLLNDLGITSWRAGEMDAAQNYLQEALHLGNDLEDQSHVGVIHANLGLILLQKGLSEKAQELCKKGWHLGKKMDNTESVEQSNYCLDQIKYFLQNEK